MALERKNCPLQAMAEVEEEHVLSAEKVEEVHAPFAKVVKQCVLSVMIVKNHFLSEEVLEGQVPSAKILEERVLLEEVEEEGEEEGEEVEVEE